MRLSVWYNPKTDKYINKNVDTSKCWEREECEYNGFGHLFVNYVYIYDHKLFTDKKMYYKYLDKEYKRKHFIFIIRQGLGNRIIKLGHLIKYGRHTRSVLYKEVYPYWRRRR